jgi:hypothetical protein
MLPVNQPALAGTAAVALAPSQMPRVGAVDPRFQSYNIEMVEITGGNFWKPYQPPKSKDGSVPTRTSESADARLFQYRPPIDLANPRLRMLAAALGPAYLRVSGTWANTTYFADTDAPPASPPAGFTDVLTRRQWRGVIAFAQSVQADIVTSFGTGQGNRDAAGDWRPEQAHSLLAYTASAGGTIAAAEFTNEPDLAAGSGTPKGYDAAAYGRDFQQFYALMKRATPATLILGPATIGNSAMAPALIAASGPRLDAVSYHYYRVLSKRCGGTATPVTALSEEWLSGADRALAFYRALRDRLEPGKPIWLTETADAACGGNPWASAFIDTFRYLDQLGRLARSGVKVVMHNTLAASDYGMLDETSLQPRPKYWGALLWRRLMGATVLDSGVPIATGLHVYAHCQRDVPGGVSLLVLNTDRAASHALRLSMPLARYTLDASSLEDREVRLNGTMLRLSASDELPALTAATEAPGTLVFAPATITFLAVPMAANPACR